MCEHEQIQIVEQDEQPLFQVNYCQVCDTYFDGNGISLELYKLRIQI